MEYRTLMGPDTRQKGFRGEFLQAAKSPRGNTKEAERERGKKKSRQKITGLAEFFDQSSRPVPFQE